LSIGLARRPLLATAIAILATVATLTTSSATTAAWAAAQRIDMKVLVLGTSASEPDLVSWQAALEREGVPFETIVTSPGHAPITAATLSDTLSNGTQEAKYQAVIVTTGQLPECTEAGCHSTLSASEWSALEEYEHTFNVRQLSGDIFPGAGYGLNSPTLSGPLDGTQAALTSEGKTVFPYLSGPVTMDTGTYGYEATPLSTQAPGASFHSLVSGPNESSLVGIYTHASGVQEMVETFNQNSFQLQAELLRHGAINWVTRGVYFGDQRNYLEANIDDNLLSDDSWNTTTHANDFSAAAALREVPADVEFAAKWSKENNFRIDMLFNGQGTEAYRAEHGSDPLLAALRNAKNSFGWISHTWDHRDLDVSCATQRFIEAEFNQNNIWASSTLGLTESTSPTAVLGNDNPSVIVTGEHSGLANLIPGSPGVINPPSLESVEATSGGSLAPGTYVYALTDDFTPGGGQSIASVSPPVTVTGPGQGAVTLRWEAVCLAAQFKLYREVAGSNEWTLVATLPAPSTPPPNSWFANPTTNTNVAGGGPLVQTYSDTGTAGTSAPAPPSVNEAAESPYPQNPNLIPAFEGVGIQYFGSDASKPYPNPAIAGSTTPAYSKGSTFADGPALAVPRYPTNIYYNVSTEAQELDEFNTLYTPVSQGGKCVETATTTCRSSPANFAEIVNNVDTNMFQHMMGNDPRPHYFHQTNLMGTPPPGEPTTGTPPNTPPSVGDGLFYSVMGPLLAQYNRYFAASAPYEQPTFAAAGELLAEQAAWKQAQGAAQVTGYIEGRQVTIQNNGSNAIAVPLTGVAGVGSPYGGIQSGWASVAPGTSSFSATEGFPQPPLVTTNPTSKTVIAGESATFTAAASGVPTPTVQWQLSTNGGATFTNDTTDAGNSSGTLTVSSATLSESGYQYRAVFKNANGEANSAAATLTVNARTEAPKITTNPMNRTVTAGEGATFTAAANGNPAPTVQWQVSKNGGFTFANDTTDGGTATGTLTIAATSAAQSGWEYRAVFTNSAGSATTAVATLTVKAPLLGPVVSGLFPSVGSAFTWVTITGKAFNNVQAVYFGARPAFFFPLSSTAIAAWAPAGFGTVDVTVRTPVGTSATSSGDRFTYLFF
jgi:hypothetical protein